MLKLLELPSPYYASVGVIVYLAVVLVRRLLKKDPAIAVDFSALVFVVIDSVGIVAGANVVKVSFTATKCGDTPIEQIYLFIGGGAVLYASIRDLWSKFKEV